MTAIINRTPTGRIISLHSELVYLSKLFGNSAFTLNDMKYDANKKINPLMFFPLAIRHETLGIYDPYLRNPLSPAKFHLTQSIQYDSQKSKSVSECFNAMEGLGWLEKTTKGVKITPSGFEMASISYEDRNFLPLLRKSLLGYGVFIGFLYKCITHKNSEDMVIKSKIKIGYPDTHEYIDADGYRIPLSTGSTKDTIVRTRASLFAWAITSGFALPENVNYPKDKELWHVEILQEIRKKNWNWHNIKVFINESIFDGTHNVTRPISYNWMTKSTKALRERGQAEIRINSMEIENIVNNRRFGIVYLLGLASENDKTINFEDIYNSMISHKDLFVINENGFKDALEIDMDIATISGIPFMRDGGDIKPLTKIDMTYLRKEAPYELVEKLDQIFKEIQQ